MGCNILLAAFARALWDTSVLWLRSHFFYGVQTSLGCQVRSWTLEFRHLLAAVAPCFGVADLFWLPCSHHLCGLQLRGGGVAAFLWVAIFFWLPCSHM